MTEKEGGWNRKMRRKGGNDEIWEEKVKVCCTEHETQSRRTLQDSGLNESKPHQKLGII